MASVQTDKGEFEFCFCGNPEGHVGPVWHPEVVQHPSGAKLQGRQSETAEAILKNYPKKRELLPGTLPIAVARKQERQKVKASSAKASAETPNPPQTEVGGANQVAGS